MGRTRTIRGTFAQSDTPAWRPLEHLVGYELVGDFMWMGEVELADSRRLQVYKHIYTRRSIHLDPDGAAFVYESRERYRPYPVSEVLAAVFATLPGLWGVTEDQIARSWAAVERLEERSGR